MIREHNKCAPENDYCSHLQPLRCNHEALRMRMLSTKVMLITRSNCQLCKNICFSCSLFCRPSCAREKRSRTWLTDLLKTLLLLNPRSTYPRFRFYPFPSVLVMGFLFNNTMCNKNATPVKQKSYTAKFQTGLQTIN